MPIDLTKFRTGADVCISLEEDPDLHAFITIDHSVSDMAELAGPMLAVLLDHTGRAILIRQANANDDDSVRCEMESLEEGVYVRWFNLPFNVNRCFSDHSIIEEFIDSWEVEPGVGILIHLPEWFFAERLHDIAA